MAQSGVTDTAPAPVAPTDTSDGVGWRHVAVLAAAVLVPLLMFGAGVLLPYYVNDLHRLPLAELTSGAHDPKDLWPQSGVVQLAGFASLALLPMAALTGLGLGGLALALLCQRPGSQRVPKALAVLLVMVVSLAALLLQSSDTGAALTTWRLD